MSQVAPRHHKTKCVVWDLDETVWNGTLLEHGGTTLRDGVREVITTLDERGILHSVASKNDPDLAMRRLEQLGLAEYFLYPQIGWGPKSESIRRIADSINIGIDTVAFVDDQPYELEEVHHSLPEVLCIDAAKTRHLPLMPEMSPRFVTSDSSIRRQMYRSEQQRRSEEHDFHGPQEAFLATLKMQMAISPAGREDLCRAEELTQRTNQLNTTGYTYSFEELDAFRASPDHLLLMASLDDKLGTYGTIGLALIETGPLTWTIKLLLMSCRVMSRGAGGVFISQIRRMARDANVRLLAEFIENDRNRMMYMTYKFNHFSEINRQGKVILLDNDLSRVQPDPDYITVTASSLQRETGEERYHG